MTTQPSLLQCPECTRVLHFSHDGTNAIRCECGSVIGRTGGLLSTKSVFAVQQNFGIIQPGTEGEWNGRKFRVLGRFRAWIEEFVFNYWTILFEDGQMTLLGEGYGLYAVYETLQEPSSFSSLVEGKLEIGEHRTLSGRSFLLERKYTCYKWEVEGEAWLPGWNSRFSVYEFAETNGKRLELMGPERQDPAAAFDVHYTSFGGLRLTGLRAEDDEGKTFTCVNCSAENHVKTFPFAQSYACSNCRQRYRLKDGASFERQVEHHTVDATPDIPIGTKGRFRNIDYEVIGFTMKEEQNVYRSKWKEYTLYNPAEGFAFLSEYSGHWTWLRERGDAPVTLQALTTSVYWQEEEYVVFNSYVYKTIHAAGEFPYNIFNDDDEKQVREYISPPELWISEKHDSEGILWYLGEHVSGEEMKAAFGPDIQLPHKSGVGAVEPRGYIGSHKLAFVTFVALMALMLLHVFLSYTKRDQLIFQQGIGFPDSASTVSFVTPRFTLDKWKSNLHFYVDTYMDNTWLELEAVLVNAKDGTEYSINQGVEFYQGYADGERWTEGSLNETAWMSSIPAGEYILQLQGTRDVVAYAGALPASFMVKVTYDVINHRNLLVCGLALLLWPAATLLRIRYIESQRWSNSPYQPQSDNDE
jgi:hypothetical protein